MEAESQILLNKEQARHALNVSMRTLDNLILGKILPVIRIGRRVLISRETLQRFARHDQPTRPSGKK